MAYQLPQLLTVAEIAETLKVSKDTVTRLFEDRPGVIVLGSQETRYTRRYRVLRIPKPVLEKFLHERTI
jgi:transcriptional regulator GlxA family with amidase domain